MTLHQGRDEAQGVPEAPWGSRIEAVLWWQIAPRAAASAWGPRRRRLPIALGGLVEYCESPVGPYRELLGARLVVAQLRVHAQVEFMAVDSPASVVGGRRNWALPKELARFEVDRPPCEHVRVSGAGWAVALGVSVRSHGLPVGGKLPCAQVGPHGDVETFDVSMRGRARPASVRIDEALGLTGAPGFRKGRYPAVVLSGQQLVTSARSSR